MRKFHLYLSLGLTLLVAGPASAVAADLGGVEGVEAADTCFLMRRSPILDLASADEMEAEVANRYETALRVATDGATINSRSPRYVWSTGAKTACGKAIGYFHGREINEDMISKCDCYHGRMLNFMR